jgi:hypothetical protein
MTVRLDDVAARATAQSLDELLAQLENEPDSRAKELAFDIVDGLLQLYGEGLARLVTAQRDGRLSAEFLGADDVVAQLLVIHDLLPRSAHPAELVQLGRRRPAEAEDDAALLLAAADGATECNLCAAPIAANHRHLLDLEHRQFACACQACSLLFDAAIPSPSVAGAPSRAGSAGDLRFTQRYRLIPRRHLVLDPKLLDDGLWERLEVPVDIAFVFKSSAANRAVAFYPGPMGTTESALPLPAWEEIVARSSVLSTLEPDVEAVLVRRTRGAREYMIVPVDECYRLAGAMRMTWEGISGGDRMRKTVDAFFRRVTRLAPRERVGAESALDITEETACVTTM